MRQPSCPAVHDPLRIVVAGNSTSLMVQPTRPTPGPGTYGEQLVPLLAEHGISAVVEHTGRWFGLIDDLRRRYEDAVRNRFPDVVVLHYGMAEAQPRVVPTSVMRFLTTWDHGGTTASLAYRRHVNPRLWRVLRDWQRWASRHVRLRTWRRAPSRFAAELRHLGDMARQETGALVLVVDLDPPGPRMEHWMPGYRRRWQVYQQVLRDTVEEMATRHGGNVRLVEASADLTGAGAECLQRLLPDGLHRSIAGHRLVAERIAREILDWRRALP